jgi:hypothetical protein
MEDNKRLKGPECKNGIRDRGLRQQLRSETGIKDPGARRQLRPGIEKMSDEIFRGKIANQVVGTPGGLQRTMDWILWRIRPPLKRKKKLQIQQEPVI